MITLEYKWLGTDLPFEEGLQIQEARVQELISQREQPGTFYFLEHSPVYTTGIRKKEAEISPSAPHPVVNINRGGLATYHGPGQLVGYLVTDLIPLGKDLHAYLRLLEEALILACQDIGIHAERSDGLTGVWSNGRKICSMGVGVRKWISMHGFAMNIAPESLPPFAHINPCGIDGVSMSCLHQEGDWKGTTQDYAQGVFQNMEQLLEEL